MEHLTKQQIVLLTLFTSFVTSIATGIVTVALVDQAPTGVTSTVNHVIERTLEEVEPSGVDDDSQAAAVSNVVSGGVVVNPVNQIEHATMLAQQSLVTIMDGNDVTGLGVVVASSGIIMSDKSTVAGYGTYTAVTSNGNQYPLQILQSQNNGDIVFLYAEAINQTASSSASTTPSSPFFPATFASLGGRASPQIGETVIALSSTGNGLNSTSVAEGIIKKINMTLNDEGYVDASSTVLTFETNIDPSDISVGSPLFDSAGNFLGIRTYDNEAGNFYPVVYLKSVIPSL